MPMGQMPVLECLKTHQQVTSVNQWVEHCENPHAPVFSDVANNCNTEVPRGQNRYDIPTLEIELFLNTGKFQRMSLKGIAGTNDWDKGKALMLACGVMDLWTPLNKVYMQKISGNQTAEVHNILVSDEFNYFNISKFDI